MNRSFTAAWMRDAPDAVEILPRLYCDAAARARAVHAASQRRVDPDVLATLETPTAAQQTAARLLGTAGTVCVVTGQQAGLFGGPLYTIYKTAAAIADARHLTAETGVPCVPVFWLQNEDHDFDEIAQCTVLDGEGERITLRVTAASTAPRSVAFRTLGTDLDTAIEALQSALGGQPHGAAVLDQMRHCYHVGDTADASFKALIQALFGEHGLLIVDPSHPNLARAAQAVHQRAVDEAGPIAEALVAHGARITAAGYTVQVHVRPGAPLSFIHPDGRAGPRYRVEREGAGYRLLGTDRSLSEAALQGALQAGAASTSALLRPILQDHWLPTAAYVGGPGEIAYLAQLPPLYAHFGMPMPLIVPRARFRVGDGLTKRLLAALDLQPDQLSEPWQRLLDHLGTAHGEGPDLDTLRATLLEPFEQALSGLRPELAALDKGLLKASHKAEATVTSVVERLVARYGRARALNDEVALDRLSRLRSRLCPDGAPQERVYAWPHCAARYGIDAFIDAVLEAVVPFDGTLKDLQF